MRFISKIKKVATTLTCHIPEPGSPPKKKPVKNNITNQRFILQAPETGNIAMRRRLARIKIDTDSEKAPSIHIVPDGNNLAPRKSADDAASPKRALSSRRRSLSPAVSRTIKSMAITIDIKTLSKLFDESELDAKRYSTRASAFEM